MKHIWQTLLLLTLACSQALGAEVKIGVLALRGPEIALQMWSPTAAHLQARLPEHQFSIVPLDFDEIHLAVRQRRVDFVLANPSYYVELENLYGVTPVVTMRNRHGPDQGYSIFGGVIFTRSDRHDIRSITDLKGKRFAAVSEGSFGGWQTGWREMLRHRINPETDFSQRFFIGTHDGVVFAVRDGVADAGTVRTETLERMAAEGKIDLSDFFVLGERRTEGFPLRHSTELYPEWPLAKLDGVPEKLAVDVAVALMLMGPDTLAARVSQTTGWTLPLNYQPVHQALRELRIGPYAHLRHLSFREVWQQYWHWGALALLFLLLLLVSAGYIGQTNRRLRLHQQELRELNSGLEARVQERTEKVELLFERERFLRGVVEMVADVNEILITSRSGAEVLQACCDRLVAHPDYRFAWINLLENGQLQLAAKSYGTGEFIKAMQACQGSGPAAQALQENRTVVLDDLGPERRDQALTAGVYAVAALPLRQDVFSAPLGTLCVFTARPAGFDQEEVAMLEQLAGDIGFAVHAFRQQGETLRLQQERIGHYESTILSLVDLIEKRDTYTAGHTRRVAHYCERIARQMGWQEAEIAPLKQAAILHDIGKIAIPDAVLLKPGGLTPVEYELIQQHVLVGYDTLSRIDMYKNLADILKYHHERQDGSGYPAGLKGDAIPEAARIMAVADSFDAMTTNRIYRPRKSVPEALAEIASLAGQHYDPAVVEAALAALKDVEPPPLADQLPKTPIEQQRFAYFFNDQLTRVHNPHYLNFLLRNQLLGPWKWLTQVELRHFSRVNKEQGWRGGNQVLAQFAAHLQQRFPETLIFRVMGDDFILLSHQPIALEAGSLDQAAPLAETGVQAEIRQRPLDEAGMALLQELT